MGTLHGARDLRSFAASFLAANLLWLANPISGPSEAVATESDAGGAAGLGTAVAQVGSTAGVPNSLVTFAVTLDTGGLAVASVEMRISFDGYTPITPDGVNPDCTVNPAINKNLTQFVYAGSNTIATVVIGDLSPIPDGAVLFNCTVGIDLVAPVGSYPLPCQVLAVTNPSGLFVPASCTPGAIEVVNPTTLVDHYKCYQGTDLKNPPFPKQSVDTSDQIGDEPVEVQKVKYVCSPVDKNGEGIDNPSGHLTCYQVKGGNLEPPPTALVSTQFQQSNFALKKPKLLCVPSTKMLLP